MLRYGLLRVFVSICVLVVVRAILSWCPWTWHINIISLNISSVYIIIFINISCSVTRSVYMYYSEHLLLQTPVSPKERCCSVAGAVKQVHHRLLPFDKCQPPIRNAVYARSPLVVPPTASKLISCPKYCERWESVYFPLRQSSQTQKSQSLSPLDARSWTLESARPTQKSWTLVHCCFARSWFNIA